MASLALQQGLDTENGRHGEGRAKFSFRPVPAGGGFLGERPVYFGP
jgi:hypothetical protein